MLSQSQRERYLPTIDRHTRKLGLYTAYQLSELEYVTEIYMPRGAIDVKILLESIGYEYNGLSAVKYHPNFRPKTDDGSLRKVPEEHPPVDVRLTRDWKPHECQYHIHLFEIDNNVVEIYSHYELRPDFFRPNLNYDRLKTHYRPAWGKDYLLGETCGKLRGIVND